MNMLFSTAIAVLLMIFFDLKGFEGGLTFAVIYIAFNTIDILKHLKNEHLTDEESLRISYERDRLIAALKAMQETNPGTLTFLPKSAAEIKKARAAWVNASALLSEIEKNDGGKNASLKP